MLFPLPGTPVPSFLLMLTHPSGLRIKCPLIREASLNPLSPKECSQFCFFQQQCLLIVLITIYSCIPPSSAMFWFNIGAFCQSVRRNLRRSLPALHQHMCSTRHGVSIKLQEGRVKCISYFILEAVEFKESSHHFLWACGFLEGPSPNMGVTVPCCPVECLSPDVPMKGRRSSQKS